MTKGKKWYCSICGKEGKYSHFYSIEDGFVCTECLGKLKNLCFSRKPRAFTLAGWKYDQQNRNTILRNYTSDQAKKRLEYLNANAKLKDIFQETVSTEDGNLVVDEKRGLFYIKNKEYEIFSTQDISGYSIDYVYDKNKRGNYYTLTEIRLMIELKHPYTRFAFYQLKKVGMFDFKAKKEAKNNAKASFELLNKITGLKPKKKTKTYCVDRVNKYETKTS